MIIGHGKIIDYIDQAVLNNKLAHAYCFVGPDQVGKRTIAKYTASKLLKIDSVKLPTHPDFLYLEREEDEKKGRLKKDISISQAKQVGNFLQNKSWLGGMKVVIIDEAERINDEAANALLKTLEESVDNSLIILLTTDEHELPVTVRSRCQTMEFQPVPEEEIERELVARGYEKERAALAVRFAWGRPGRAVSTLENEGVLDEYFTELERFQKISGRPFHEKLKIVDDLFGDKDDKDTVRKRDNLIAVLDLWIMYLREVMLSAKESGRKFAGVIDELRQAQGMLGENIHPRLLVERILLKL